MSFIRRMSERRLMETSAYLYRIRLFLLQHPYCQVWLQEHAIEEREALIRGGVVTLASGSTVSVPLATQVHHMNKRRGVDLLDQQYWLAVSAVVHRRIENNKAWARAQGYLRDF